MNGREVGGFLLLWGKRGEYECMARADCGGTRGYPRCGGECRIFMRCVGHPSGPTRWLVKFPCPGTTHTGVAPHPPTQSLARPNGTTLGRDARVRVTHRLHENGHELADSLCRWLAGLSLSSGQLSRDPGPMGSVDEGAPMGHSLSCGRAPEESGKRQASPTTKSEMCRRFGRIHVLGAFPPWPERSERVSAF